LHRSINQVAPALTKVFRDLFEGRRPWPLLLTGGVGTGKTLAALALADYCRSAAYYTIDEVCDVVMGSDGNAKYCLDRAVDEVKLMIIDEIGARENTGDLLYGRLKKILDRREARASSKAIYISNLLPSELADVFDERICSRLCCGTRFELNGPDRRMQRNEQAMRQTPRP